MSFNTYKANIKTTNDTLTGDAAQAINGNFTTIADQLAALGTAAQHNATDFDAAGAASTVSTSLAAHTSNHSNPHAVTAAQTGALPITGGDLTGHINVTVNSTSDSHVATLRNSADYYVTIAVQSGSNQLWNFGATPSSNPYGDPNNAFFINADGIGTAIYWDTALGTNCYGDLVVNGLFSANQGGISLDSSNNLTVLGNLTVNGIQNFTMGDIFGNGNGTIIFIDDGNSQIDFQGAINVAGNAVCTGFICNGGGSAQTFTISAGMTLQDASVTLGTSAGTRFGTATNQKLAFYGSTPVTQQASTVSIETALSTLGLRATGTATFTGILKGVVTSFGTAHTASASTDSTILVTATGQTITLPTAVSKAGTEFTIKLTVSGSCTIATTSSQTIDGSTSYTLSAQWKYVTVQSDGANWVIIANN